jgi:hypothetical protein
MRVRVLMFVVLSLLVGTPTASAAPRGLELGFLDGAFASPDPVQRAAWLDDARSAGAGIVRIELSWNGAAPARPADAENPADVAYRWGVTDAAVQDATARGLRVLLSINGAPPWAEGPRRPRSAKLGTWKPDPQALGEFAEAAARRYPGVTRWQVWNEPNLDAYLTPQWTRRNGRFSPAAAQQYRRMLNSAYTALKEVNSRNTVVVGGTAPYGDPPGGARTRPVTFWEEVFKWSTSFDVFAHHPYSVDEPRRHALNRADASVPDLGRLTRLVRSAVRRGLAVPRKPKPLWITEIGWDSNPPDPNGVPAQRHAAWLADAFYVLWKQGATKIVWTFVRDQAPTGGYDVTNQSGVYLLSGAPKPAQRAFAFPLACERLRGGRVQVWGKAPQTGAVTVERATGRGFAPLRRLTVGPSRVFTFVVRASRLRVRASQGAQTSLTCRAS